MEERLDLFADLLPTFKIKKPIRLIELFAGYGSQALALKYLDAKFEHWKIAEWNYKSCYAYHQIHMGDDKTNYSEGMTKEQLVDYLTEKGISSDWNKAMTREQISRIAEWELRRIYNSIKATHNLVNISRVGGVDLEIVEKDKYCYILTYSFPCQDLSLAGSRKGMAKGDETRSGLLWEVERILKECKELNCLPDVLLMENVPQVHGKGNYENFKLWIKELVKLGYENYYEDLIATDYGIPQIRNRTFMVSVADAHYDFPKAIKLEKKLKDLLEKEVDEKYYLSERAIKGLEFRNEINAEKGRGFKFEPTDGGVQQGLSRHAEEMTQMTPTSQLRGGKKHITPIIPNSAEQINTIDTRVGAGAHWSPYIDDTPVEIKRPHGYFPGSAKETDTISTIDSSIDYQHIVIGEKKLIKNATEQGDLEGEAGDGVDISSRMEYHRGTVQKEKTQTLTTMGGENQGVIVMGNYSPSGYNATRIVSPEGSAPTVRENHGQVTGVTIDEEKRC